MVLRIGWRRADLLDKNVSTEYVSDTPTAINMLNEVKKFEGGLFPGAPRVTAPELPRGIGDNRGPAMPRQRQLRRRKA